MILSEYPATIREALACFEALRRLQFPAADIYFTLSESNLSGVPTKLLVLLRTQGKQWAYDAGPIEGDHKKFAELLRAAAREWNEGRQAEMSEIYQNSKIITNGMNLIASLDKVGIAWTRTDA